MKLLNWIAKLILLLNTLFEIPVGLIMIFAPAVFFPEINKPEINEVAHQLVTAQGRAFGFAAIAVGVLSLLMSLRPLSREVLFAGMGALAVFHIGLSIAQLLNQIEGYSALIALVIHGAFAVIFLAVFIWNAGKRQEPVPASAPAA
ncbi:MAG: hypothetical protein NW241_08390 [Bacteroidia bacterium]|nr:hypothetical protein [Bacteroidia bacterium]